MFTSRRFKPSFGSEGAPKRKRRKKRRKRRRDQVKPGALFPDNKTAIEEELGVAAAEETEGELVQERAEREIVGGNLLGTFGPVIALVCANHGNRFSVHETPFPLAQGF